MTKSNKQKGPWRIFFQRLAKILMPSLVPNRQALAVALAALSPLPPTLQSVAQQQSAQGATWRDMTAPENVEWAVHPGGSVEPEWPLALVKTPENEQKSKQKQKCPKTAGTPCYAGFAPRSPKFPPRSAAVLGQGWPRYGNHIGPRGGLFRFCWATLGRSGP